MTAAAQRAQQALSSGQFDEVAKVLDAAEVESTNPDVLADWPHALHLLGLVYNGALEDARFLWKRIPAGAKQNNPELEAVFRLLQFSWNRHYTGIWTALQGYSWSALLQPLVEALTLRFRESMLDLVSRAYSTLPLAKLASLVGLKEAEALSCEFFLTGGGLIVEELHAWCVAALDALAAFRGLCLTAPPGRRRRRRAAGALSASCFTRSIPPVSFARPCDYVLTSATLPLVPSGLSQWRETKTGSTTRRRPWCASSRGRQSRQHWTASPRWSS